MKKNKSVLTIAAGLLLALANPAASLAQTTKPAFNRAGLGLRINNLYDLKFTAYDQLSNGFAGEDLRGLNGSKTKFDLAFGGTFIFFFTPSVSMDVSADFGKMTGANKIDYYKSNVSFISTGINFDLKPWKLNRPFKFVPYGRLSTGRASYNTERKFISDDQTFQKEKGAVMFAGIGGGLRYHINNNWYVNLQSEMVTVFTDAWDGYNYGSGKDHMIKTSIGFTYTFGKKPHIDRVNTQSGASTSGVSEEELKKQKAELNDSLTQLKNSLADLSKQIQDLKNMNKDSDMDGVPDLQDKCPNVKGAYSAQGCPDSTIKPEPVKSDTVKPVLSNEDLLKKQIMLEMSRVYFTSASAQLNSESRRILINAAQMLQNNPDFKLTIVGYADQKGTDKFNMNLSKQRAENVATFLVNHGIDKNRIEVVAKGKVKNVGSKNSELEDAINRRVEFIVH